MVKESRNQKQQIIKLAGCIFCVLIVVTFFSKTAMNMMLTSVRVCMPSESSLSRSVTCEGEVTFKEIIPIYTPISTKVLEVYVKEGDIVEKGQKLYSLDTAQLAQEIKTKHLELQKATLELQGLQSEVYAIETKVAKQNKVLKTKLSKESKESEVEDLRISLQLKEVKTNEVLFEEGLISEEELRKSQLELLNLQADKDERITTQQQEREEDTEETRSMLEDLEKEEEAKKQEISIASLEIEQLKLELEELENKKEEGALLVASKAGVIMANDSQKNIVAKDCMVSESEMMLQIGSSEAGFKVLFNVDQDVDFIQTKNEVKLKFKNQKEVVGTVEYIKSGSDSQEVCVSFNDEAVKMGETVECTFSEPEIRSDKTIPCEAVYKDGEDEFVYVAEQITDLLGDAYLIRKKKVYTGASNETSVAIEDGVSSRELIIISSEKELVEGERIKIENENEVLANEET